MNLQQARHSARAFLMAARRSFEHRPVGIGRTEMLLVPGVVCAAFSVELSLKAIVIAAGGTPARGRNGHDLVTLFGQVRTEVQDTIISALGISRSAFEPLLEGVTDAFEKWRYIYEQTGDIDITQHFLYNLAEATHQAMAQASGI